MAIRSESYASLQTEPRLGGVRQEAFPLNPVARTEFRAVIEGPAARATEAGRPLKIEPALTQALLHDADGADALPLLAFTPIPRSRSVRSQPGGKGELLGSRK